MVIDLDCPFDGVATQFRVKSWRPAYAKPIYDSFNKCGSNVSAPMWQFHTIRGKKERGQKAKHTERCNRRHDRTRDSEGVVHGIQSNVRCCKATTIAPFRALSPFTMIQRPSRCSCPTPATSRTGAFFTGASFAPSVGRAHSTSSKDPLGGEMNWSELITPGADTVPTSENDLNFASSFHSRMSPSHDPARNQF